MNEFLFLSERVSECIRLSNICHYFISQTCLRYEFAIIITIITTTNSTPNDNATYWHVEYATRNLLLSLLVLLLRVLWRERAIVRSNSNNNLASYSHHRRCFACTCCTCCDWLAG